MITSAFGAISEIFAFVSSNPFSFRSTKDSFAPSFAIRRAVSCPNPEPAHVIINTLSSKRFIIKIPFMLDLLPVNEVILLMFLCTTL